MTKVSFQGVDGSYSQGALLQLFKTNPFLNIIPSAIPTETFELIIRDLNNENNSIDYCLLPIENSSTGTFHQVMDLIASSNLFINAEVHHHERHCLLALPGTKISDIVEIRSQNYILDQCQKFINAKNIPVSLSRDPAFAASVIKSKMLKNVACIAGERAAKLYGLDVLMKGIEDDSNTITRYALLSKSRIHPERHVDPKTSILVTCKNQVGSFFKVLSCFALRDINLSKVESRPSTRSIMLAKPWEYVLYVDIDGSTSETAVQKAIDNANEFCQVQILGSYPRYQPPIEIVQDAIGIGM